MASKASDRRKPPDDQTARRKPEGERREAIMKVLATTDERDAFQAAADAAGMSLSTWLRHIAIKATKPPIGR
jgi:hypothetical protein